MNKLFWFVVVLTLAVYAVMVVHTLPAIAVAAGGLAAFDLRPTGYSFDEAVAFLSALSPTGRQIYTGPQRLLDLAYPALLAMTTAWAIIRLAPTRLGRGKYLLAATAIPGMIFDYLENIGVGEMLAMPLSELTAEQVSSLSIISQMKALFGTVSLSILLVLLIGYGVAWLRKRQRKKVA